MLTADSIIIIGELLGSFAIGLAFGFLIAGFMMAGKTTTK